MQALVKPQTNCISPDGLSFWHLIGMEADGHRYAISINPCGASFARGSAHWYAESTPAALIKRALDDHRCKLFVFTSLEEYANWLLGKVA